MKLISVLLALSLIFVNPFIVRFDKAEARETEDSTEWVSTFSLDRHYHKLPCSKRPNRSGEKLYRVEDAEEQGFKPCPYCIKVAARGAESRKESKKDSKEDPWIWLSKIAGNDPPEINITGKWRDTAGTGMLTWGEGFLKQDGDKVTGVISDYNVIGIVSGKKVYLVFLYRNRVYYTARLELSQQFVQDELVGSYFKARDKEQVNPYPTSFTKLKER